MKKRILIVEDNITLSQIVKDWLEREGYAVATAIDEPYARKLLRKESFDLILSDVRLPQGDGISLLEWINKEKMDIPFVIMTEYASVTDAVRAIKMGAKDYLAKPVFHEQLVEMVKELLKPVSTVRSKEKELFKRTSPKAMEAMNMAELVAPSDISVLILGANGTGKESIARSIHFHSNRKNKPFVAVNCGAIPHELAASTFFGHAKGAFTGADADKGGCFEAANGGTLFLDEIGTLPYDMQSSLLRVFKREHLCQSAQVWSVWRMSVSWQRLMKILGRLLPRGVSVRTCTIVWVNLRYDNPHLPSVPKIFCRLPTSSARNSQKNCTVREQALPLKRNGYCSHTPGQAI